MKKQSLWNPLLALTGTVSSVFCLISGRNLHLQRPGLLLFLWILTAFAAQRKPLTGLCLSLVWLWDWGQILPVFRCLGLALLSAWGLAPAPIPPEWVDSAAGFWGCLQLVFLCTALRGGKRMGGTVLTMLLPALFCLMLPEAEPDSLPLFCLLAVVLLLLLTNAVRAESAVQARQLLKIALLPVLLFLAGLFLWSPYSNYVNRSELARSRIAELFSGRLAIPVWQTASDCIDLQNTTLPDNTPILEVTSDCTGVLYLRMQDYDTYTGLGWQSTLTRQEILGGSGSPLEQITVRTFRTLPRLLACWPPPDTQLTGGAAPGTAPSEYSLSRYSPAPAAAPDAVFLALPPETRQGLAPILNALPDAEALPRAIGNWVQTSARYDRNAPAPSENCPDFALWFLQEADRGYCLHFATAAAVLLRSAGFPARLVTGFLAETQAGKAVTVTEGHAWAEYYAEGTWHILDATPCGETPALSEPQPAPPFPSPLCLLAFLPLIPLQRRIRLLFRRWKQRFGSPNRRALSLFREACLLSRRLNLPLPQNLIDIAEKAQYSQHSVTLQELAAFADFRQICRETKIPLPKRLWERYVYCL